MKSFFICSMAVVAFIGLASCSPMLRARAAQLELVHQFPNFTWIENMAVRSNGEILGNDISGSKIYLVDPHHAQANPPVAAQFSNGTCIAGIVEVQEDVFYVPSAQGSIYQFKFLPNTTVVWEVDMRCYKKGGQASVRKVAEIPEAVLLNGMGLLSRGEGTILMADSVLGLVWKLNVYTGAYEIVFDHPVLKPVKGANVEFGVNGVHVVDSVLYFTNTDQGILGKVSISTDGFPTGLPVNITTEVPAADDFAIDSSGNFWVAQNVANTFVRVSSDGTVQTIAGGTSSSDLIGPVAAVFGRGIHDRDTLYISTDGLSESNSGVPLTTNGKIAKVDTNPW